MDAGREELAKALRHESLPVQNVTRSDALKSVAEALHYQDLDALYAAVGEHHVSARAVAQRVERELRGGEEQLPVTTARPPHAPSGAERPRRVGVHVEGLDDVMVRLSRCCTPVPGDEIMGFVTRGRGVSVHRADCANATALASQTQRVIEVEWDHDETATFFVSVEVEALDRSRLLRDVAQVLAEHHVNILNSTSQTSRDRVAHLRFDFELADPGHLDSILRTVERVDSVYEAHRLLPGRRTDN
jgi:GTP pyrophosphokinase